MGFFKKRKLVIIIIAVAFVVVGGVIIISVLLTRSDSKTEEVVTENTSENFIESSAVIVKRQEEVNQGAIGPLTKPSDATPDQTFQDEQLSYQPDGSFYYFSPSSNAIMKFSQTGQETVYTFEEQMSDVSFSPDRTKAIATNPEGKQLYVNLTSKDTAVLPEDTQGITWSPDSKKIMYQFVNAFKRKNTLNIADPDGKNWEEVYSFPNTDEYYQGLTFVWVADNYIIYQNEFSATDGALLTKLTLDNKEETVLSVIGPVVNFFLSPDRTFLIADRRTDDDDRAATNVVLYNLKDESFKETNLETFANKCVFEDDQNMVCAVSFDMWSDTAPELLIRYNIPTEQETTLPVADPEKPVNYHQMFYNQDEKVLYYINGLDSKFYTLDIS
ncbi:hypothetical protein KKH43_01930 [Patescibacteria group bacterium]|nr:hypothetical protein [Patescibacteria group bacterium]